MASNRLRGIPCTVVLCGLLLPQLTAAQLAAPAARPPSQLSLRQTPCPDAPYDMRALSQLLQVELRSLGVNSVQDEPPQSERSAAELAVVQLGCGSAPSTLSLELADMVSGNRLVRELVVTDVEPGARARMLSIAVASLLESSWTLLATRPPAQGPWLPASVRSALLRRLSESLPPPQPLAASAEPVEIPRPPGASAPPEPSDPLLLSITLSALAFPSHATGLLGLDLALFPSLAPGVRAGFELSAAYGRQQLLDALGPIADIDVLWLSAGAGLYFASQSQPELLIGPLLRLAYVWSHTSVDPSRYEPRDGDGLVVELGVAAWLRAELGSAWDGYLGCEVGYVPSGVTFVADTTRAVSLEDVFMAVRAGVGLRF